MKSLKKHLTKLTCIVRKMHSPLLYQLHKQYGISKKTLFYVKEYGPHSNVMRTILKESFRVLIFASILSSFGGLMVEQIKNIFITFIPLIILLPALNAMFGDYGIVVSSRFSAMLHEGVVGKKWWKNNQLKKLTLQLFVIALFVSILSVLASFAVSIFSGYFLSPDVALKILLIVLLDVSLLFFVMIFTAIFAGLYFFKKQEDPNNFLIPITTSVADFGNMVLLSILVVMLL